MAMIESLHGHLVALDTSLFIYYVERYPDHQTVLRRFFENVEQGKIRVITSVVTYLEVLVKPLHDGNT